MYVYVYMHVYMWMLYVYTDLSYQNVISLRVAVQFYSFVFSSDPVPIIYNVLKTFLSPINN